MPSSSTNQSTKVATLTLPTHDTRLAALVWPSPTGTMLFLAELNLGTQAAQSFLGALTERLENKWHEIAPLNLPYDTVLEQILLDVNKVLMMHGRLIGNPLAPRYHLAIAIIQGQSIALSTLGYISSLLVTTDHLSNINQSTPAARGRRVTKPTFEQLTCGQIESGETFIVSSVSLLDYFTTDKLKHLFNEHLPGTALREIEQFIIKLPHHSPLGIIALKFQREPAVTGTAPSIDHFLATKNKTAELLKPGLRSLFKRLRQRVAPTVLPTPTPAPEVSNLIASGAETAAKIPLQTIWREKWQHFNFKLQIMLAKLAWLKSRDTIKQTIAWWLETKLVLWRSLTAGRKIIFIVAVILLVAFCQSIVNIGKNNLKRADSEQYNRWLAQIIENQNKAQTAMIYRSDATAQEYLTAAQKILANLPRDSNTRERQWLALNENLQSLTRRLNRETIITSLTPLIRLGENDAPISTIWWNKDNFWIVNSDGATNNFNQTGKIIKKIKLANDFGLVQLATIADNKLLIQSTNNKQAIVDLNSGNVNYLNKIELMKDAFFYQGRIYYLDQKLTSIFRTSIYNDNLTAPVKWLRESINYLTTATSLSIDGAVYVAFADRIEKYSKGIKQDFAIQTISPLPPYDLIRTNSATDYLYILNKTDKAIASFDKQGKLAARFLFPQLNSINSFAVDSAKQVLYLADNAAVYKIELAEYLK